MSFEKGCNSSVCVLERMLIRCAFRWEYRRRLGPFVRGSAQRRQDEHAEYRRNHRLPEFGQHFHGFDQLYESPDAIVNAHNEKRSLPMSISDEYGPSNWVPEYRFIQHLPSEKQAMEMTEHGKHGKP